MTVSCHSLRVYFLLFAGLKVLSFNTMLFYWKQPFSSHLLHIFTLSFSGFRVRSATEPDCYKLSPKKLIPEMIPQSILVSIKLYFEEIHLIEIIFTQGKRLLKANNNCKMDLLTDSRVNWPHRAWSLTMNINGSFTLHLWLSTPNPISYIQALWFKFKKKIAQIRNNSVQTASVNRAITC